MGRGNKKLGRNGLIIVTVVIVLILLGSVIAIFGLNIEGLLNPTETDTTLTRSTFSLISYTDGEDVSDGVELTIWVPDGAKVAEPDDVFSIANFKKLESSKTAEDISVDLRAYSYIWVEIDDDGDSVFANNFHLVSGGINSHYTIDIYHQSSNVTFNILDIDDMSQWDLASDGNFTCYMDFDHYTTTDAHYDNDFDITDDDFDEMTESEIEDLFNEQNYRCQAPTYNPSDDTSKDYISDLERLTNAFVIKLVCNATVSMEDGDVNQVNITVSDTNIEIAISGEYIYLIFTEVITAPYSFDFEITFGNTEWQTITTAYSGRLVVPKGNTNLGAFSDYCEIASI